MTLTTHLAWRKALCAAVLCACSAAATAQETIKVGFLMTYSGPSGLSGQMADQAVKAFQKRYGTSAGGKTIELIRRDGTGPNPDIARRLAQEMIVREKVQLMIGPDFTPNVLAVAPLVTEAKVPTVIAGASTHGIIGEKSPYYVRTFFSLPQVVKPMAQWAYRNGVRKPFVIVADYGPGHDALNAYTAAWTEAGGKLAGSLRVPLRNTEFTSYMQRIKDAGPDAVFVFLPFGELGIQFMRAYADSGLKSAGVRLLTTSDVTDESQLDAAGDASLGVVSSGVYASSHQSPLNRQFVADFAQAGKAPRPGVGTVAVWDALRLIYDGVAAQQGRAFDPDAFMAFARGRRYDSPRGALSINAATGDINQSVYIRRVERRDGVLQNIEIEELRDASAK